MILSETCLYNLVRNSSVAWLFAINEFQEKAKNVCIHLAISYGLVSKEALKMSELMKWKINLTEYVNPSFWITNFIKTPVQSISVSYHMGKKFDSFQGILSRK